MPNPKRRHSSARRDKRRANWKISAPTLVKCTTPSCEAEGAMHMPHNACPTCGKYNGRQVLTLRRERTAEA